MKTLVVCAAAAVVLALIPIWVDSPYALHIFILLFIAIALGESWNVIGGFAGQYSVGHSAWYGLGAYTAFVLLQRKGIAPWFGVWAAVAIRQGIFFWMRAGWGLVGPLALYPMIWGTVKIRSTMAATGILYVDVVAVVIGEVLGGWLSAVVHLPV